MLQVGINSISKLGRIDVETVLKKEASEYILMQYISILRIGLSALTEIEAEHKKYRENSFKKII